MINLKHVLIIIVVLALIIGFGYWTLQEVAQSSQVLLSLSLSLEESIKQNLWDEAENRFKKLDSAWQKTQSLWTVLLNHTEIDNIDLTLAKLEQYIKTQEQGLALAEISSLKLLIRHIPEKEKLTLENIF